VPHAGYRDGTMQNISCAPKSVQQLPILVEIFGQPELMDEEACEMPWHEQGPPLDIRGDPEKAAQGLRGPPNCGNEAGASLTNGYGAGCCWVMQ
jgi:hypothetical protein